jgi:hypothetical protein
VLEVGQMHAEWTQGTLYCREPKEKESYGWRSVVLEEEIIGIITYWNVSGWLNVPWHATLWML